MMGFMDQGKKLFSLQWFKERPLNDKIYHDPCKLLEMRQKPGAMLESC